MGELIARASERRLAAINFYPPTLQNSRSAFTPALSGLKYSAHSTMNLFLSFSFADVFPVICSLGTDIFPYILFQKADHQSVIQTPPKFSPIISVPLTIPTTAGAHLLREKLRQTQFTLQPATVLKDNSGPLESTLLSPNLGQNGSSRGGRRGFHGRVW